MRRELTALGVTAGVLSILLVVASPAAAIQVTVAADDRVGSGGAFDVEATTVDVRPDDGVSVDRLVLVLSTPSGESARVHFAPDGSVLAVRSAPASGPPNEIHLDRLRRTLTVTRLGSTAPPDGEPSTFGYGAGGSGAPATYRLVLDAGALEPGTYDVRVTVHTEGGHEFTSNTERVAVAARGGERQ